MDKGTKVYEYDGEYGTLSVKLEDGMLEILHDGLDRDAIYNADFLRNPSFRFLVYRQILEELFWKDIDVLFPEIKWNSGPYAYDLEPFVFAEYIISYQRIEEYRWEVDGYYMSNENFTIILEDDGAFVRKGRIQFYKPKFYKYQGEYGLLLIRFDRVDNLHISEISLDIEKINSEAYKAQVPVQYIFKEILLETFGNDLPKFFPPHPSQKTVFEEWFGECTDSGYKLLNPNAYSVELDHTGFTVYWKEKLIEKEGIKPWENPKIYMYEGPEALLALKIEGKKYYVLSGYINPSKIDEFSCCFDCHRDSAYFELLEDLFGRELFEMFDGSTSDDEDYIVDLVNEDVVISLYDYGMCVDQDKDEIEYHLERVEGFY